MAEKKEVKKVGKGLWSLFDAKTGSLVKKTKSCPKCGEGFFMAKHSNRLVCGKCKYVEMTQTK